MTGQNKDKNSLALDSLQAQNYQLLGLQGVSKVRSDILSAFISEITQTTLSKIKYVIPYSFYIEWTIVSSMASFIFSDIF